MLGILALGIQRLGRTKTVHRIMEAAVYVLLAAQTKPLPVPQLGQTQGLQGVACRRICMCGGQRDWLQIWGMLAIKQSRGGSKAHAVHDARCTYWFKQRFIVVEST